MSKMTANELCRTICVVSDAIGTVLNNDDNRKLDLLRRTEGFRKGALVKPSWIKSVKDMTLQQLFDLAVELKENS